MSRRAMQIHGAPVTQKSTVQKKLLRDALVLPIYEGTSQIQSLMATKDELLEWLKIRTCSAQSCESTLVKCNLSRPSRT